MASILTSITPFGITYENGFPVVDTDILYDFLGYSQYIMGIVQKDLD